MICRVLVLYYSRNGATRKLADAIAEGVEASSAEVMLRTVSAPGEPASDRDLCVSENDLKSCDALIMGSPTRFGHMSHHLQAFWETTASTWVKGDLVDKPAAVFTSSSSLHGGQESTLLSMAVPLLHHGMIMVGLPYTEPSLQNTTGGGTPYGASHVEHSKSGAQKYEHELAVALGRRVATIATQLRSKQ